MDRNETRASLRVLWALVRADGVVTPAELRLLELAAAHEGGGAAPSDPGGVDLERELEQLQSEEAQRLTLKAALAIATVEGSVSAEAHRVLERIHRALARSQDEQAPPARALATDEGAAADRMRDVQRAIAKETDDFVHRLARAGAAHGGVVDPNEYEKLVAELDAKKRALLDEALATDPGASSS
jgi:hypothetical protein